MSRDGNDDIHYEQLENSELNRYKSTKKPEFFRLALIRLSEYADFRKWATTNGVIGIYTTSNINLVITFNYIISFLK